jgi:tetratricopeptide (TPR) repeat protein
MNNLASTYGGLGLWNEAEELFVQVIEMRKRALGQEHPDTLVSMLNLASTYRNQGQLNEAEDLEVRVVETSLRLLSQVHSVILAIMGNPASTYADQGHWKEAEEVQIQAVNKLRMTLGEDYLVTITTIASLASLLKDRNASRHLLTLINVLTSTYKNQRRLSNEEVPMLTNEEGAGNSNFELIMKERLMVVEKAVNGTPKHA